jgi:hypothetical protein
MKKNILIIVLIIAVGAGSFYAGMAYGKKGSMANRPNFSSERLTANVSNQRMARNGAGFLSGEIISKDDKSIIIKLRDGGSKIVFFKDDTAVSKNAEGSLDDLKEGAEITVSGDSNQDGSVNAQSIQIRPSIDK